MHEQIHEIVDDFKNAQSRMHALARAVPDERWSIRPGANRWSVSENVEHLNMFSEVFIPLVRDGLAQARALNAKAPSRYRRGFAGWALWAMMPPPVRFAKVRAIPAFVPGAQQSPQALRDRFDRLQHELVTMAASADGLAIDRVNIPSPVNAKLHYNLFAALGMIPRHQHRHLWQAEQSL